jgi:hypothetical protein
MGFIVGGGLKPMRRAKDPPVYRLMAWLKPWLKYKWTNCAFRLATVVKVAELQAATLKCYSQKMVTSTQQLPFPAPPINLALRLLFSPLRRPTSDVQPFVYLSGNKCC